MSANPEDADDSPVDVSGSQKLKLTRLGATDDELVMITNGKEADEAIEFLTLKMQEQHDAMVNEQSDPASKFKENAKLAGAKLKDNCGWKKDKGKKGAKEEKKENSADDDYFTSFDTMDISRANKGMLAASDARFAMRWDSTTHSWRMF